MDHGWSRPASDGKVCQRIGEAGLHRLAVCVMRKLSKLKSQNDFLGSQDIRQIAVLGERFQDFQLLGLVGGQLLANRSRVQLDLDNEFC